MESAHDPGALVARSYSLHDGLRVRLRLTQARDIPAIVGLFSGEEPAHDEVELARIVRSDPRRTVAITAATLRGGRETILGFGLIDTGSAAPRLVCAGGDVALGALIREALVSRAAALASRRVA